MKIVAHASWIAMVIGALLIIGAQVGQMYFSSQAQLTQRIAPYDTAVAELTGDFGEPIGQPQLMIINDEAAFLPGKGPDGALFVSDPYLKEHGIYPLQLKTVDFVASTTQWIGLSSLLLGLGLRLWLRRKCKVIALSPA